jgi:hypothetical protein
MVPRTPSPLAMMEYVMQSLTTRYTDASLFAAATLSYRRSSVVGVC